MSEQPDGDGDVSRSALELIFTRLDRMEERTDRRFDAVDQRLNRVDQRLDGVDQRLDRVDQRLDGVDQRLDRVNQQLAVMRGDIQLVQQEFLRQSSALTHIAQLIAASASDSGRLATEFAPHIADHSRGEGNAA